MFGKRLSRALAVTATASLLMTAAVFAADDVDNDQVVGTPANDNTIAAGAQTRGTSFSREATLRIEYFGNQQHLAADSTVVLELNSALSSAGVTADDLTFDLPLTWAAGSYADPVSTSTISYTPGAAELDGSHTLTAAFKCKSGCVDTGGANAQTLNTANAKVFVTYSLSTVTPPANNPPTADAGQDVNGAEGSAIAIDGSGSSDPDGGDSLTYAWSVDTTGIDGTGSCSFANPSAAATTLTCNDDSDDASGGVFVLMLTVTDESGASDSDSANLGVSNADPALGLVAFAATSGACPTLDTDGNPVPNASLTFSASDAGLNDSLSYSVNWGDGNSGSVSGSPASHAYTAAGIYSATVTVNDDDGGSDSESSSNTFRVDYNTSGILQPINMTGTRSLFKAGSTIPVKIRITNCDGSVPTLAPSIAVQMLSGAVPSGSDEPIYSTVPDQGTTMRLSDGQYIYNLGTKTPFTPDPTATYRIYITIQPGQVVTADFGLKK